MAENEKCIFQADELKHLCEQPECKKKGKCVTLAYVRLVEDYVRMMQRFKVIRDNYGKKDSGDKEANEPGIITGPVVLENIEGSPTSN